MELSTEAVMSMAPDEASAKAARGLTSASKWSSLGCDEAAVWGECQGSGSKPYQTQVDLQGGPAFRCSCPSRKFPCKHGLAMLLLRAAQPALFAQPQQPAWVQEWLETRRAKAQRQEERAAEKANAPAPSPETTLKRQAQRWKQIEGGLEQLQLWMSDRIEQGLASLGPSDRSAFESMAARLVDAQAAGLGQRLHDVADHIGSAPDWPARVLKCFGQLQLAIETARRRDALPAATLADLRVTLGWPFEKDEVLTQGERVQDEWVVLGVSLQQRDAKLSERRTWLQGVSTGRRALLLDFAYAGTGFDATWLTGQRHSLLLAYFPSGAPLRALVAEQQAVTSSPRSLPGAHQDEWLHVARLKAGNPWVPLAPMLLEDTVPARVGEAWQLRLPGDGVLPLALTDEAAWQLLAYSGGHPVSLFGEWNGHALAPCTAWDGASLWVRNDVT